MRIYIVEDDPIILSGFSAMVKSLGYTVAGLEVDGERALQEIIRLRPDLIIMDVNLPRVDGMSVLEKVNEVVDIPCIIVTGYKDEEQIGRASRAGVYAYLQKPVDEYELQAAIQIVMSRSGAYNAVKEEKDRALQSLSDRKTVERAKGILMKQMQISEMDAHRTLQRKSRDSNMKLVDMAQRIIDAYELLH